MAELRGGKGGYGGITTMNQDHRTGPYEPHIVISKHLDRVNNVWHVKCMVCGQSWFHPNDLDQRWAPDRCVKSGGLDKEEKTDDIL